MMLWEILRGLFDAVLILFLAFLLVVKMGDAHADTNAEKVFGRWQRVSIENIREPVPEWRFTETVLGSVTNAYRHQAFEDRPAQPGGPKISPRSTAPEQVAGLQSNSLERR